MRRLLIPAAVLAVLVGAGVWFFTTQGVGRPVVAVVGSARHIVTLTVGTPRTGDRTVTLQVTDRSGAPYVAPSLPFTAVLPTAGYSSPVMPAVAEGTGGRFRVDGVPLMAPGGWQFHLSLRDTSGEEQVLVPMSVTG
jgi:hypothetical protein